MLQIHLHVEVFQVVVFALVNLSLPEVFLRLFLTILAPSFSPLLQLVSLMLLRQSLTMADVAGLLEVVVVVELVVYGLQARLL